jgi:NADPH:quinone reductase-like Zn-dependent oxidoreductase
VLSQVSKEVFLMAVMNAMQIHQYGAPDVFVYEEVERPFPGASEVLVRVRG